MDKIIYNIWVRIFMNDIESKLLDLINVKDKIIFDVGAYRGIFTSNLMKKENLKENNTKYYLFDANPNVKNYLTELYEGEINLVKNSKHLIWLSKGPYRVPIKIRLKMKGGLMIDQNLKTTDLKLKN